MVESKDKVVQHYLITGRERLWIRVSEKSRQGGDESRRLEDLSREKLWEIFLERVLKLDGRQKERFFSKK